MVNAIFNKIYNSLTSIEFNPDWCTVGLGPLDGIVHSELGLSPGHQVATIDNYGKKIIITNTRHGNMLTYEIDNGGLLGGVKCIYPYKFKHRMLHGRLSVDTVKSLIGFECMNIGTRYESDPQFKLDVDNSIGLTNPNWKF